MNNEPEIAFKLYYEEHKPYRRDLSTHLSIPWPFAAGLLRCRRLLSVAGMFIREILDAVKEIA